MASNRNPRPMPLVNPDAGRVDPLFWPLVRFVAARPSIGVVGLMRRFKIGRQRACDMLIAVTERGVLYRGHWRGVYRTHHDAWPWLLVAENDAYAPGSPGGLRGYRERQQSALAVTDSSQGGAA